MKIIPIPDELAAAYKGSGHALAAVKDGRLIDILYMRDLLPDFDPDKPEAFLSDVRLAPTIQNLGSLGEVSIGMCSCWEFCEL